MITKTFLVEVLLHDQSTIDPDEVLLSIQELLKPIDAHDPTVRVAELDTLLYEGRTRRKDNSVDIHRSPTMFDPTLMEKMIRQRVSVGGVVKI